jgi:hypothetical protein
MSLQLLQVLECVFAIFTAIGLSVDTIPRWEAWLSCFLFFALDTWRCLRVGEISTGSSGRWYAFTFNRDDSPELFACAVAFQVLLTLVSFSIFLFSL